MNKSVHILAAGGPAGVGMSRCLVGRGYDVTGEDSSKWASLMLVVPESKNSFKHDLIIPIADGVISKLVGGDNLFLPPPSHIEVCSRKDKTADFLGDLAPRRYWERDVQGAGAKGAQMVSEFLPGRNISCEMVVWHGRVLATFQKERLSYLVKEKEMNPTVSGSSAVSVCIWEDDIYDKALKALALLEKDTGDKSHGFYGIDFKEDKSGDAKITEINAGRLLTASYAYFSSTGFNLPLVGVAKFLGEDLEMPEYPLGWGQVRQVGQDPKMVPPEITKDWK